MAMSASQMADEITLGLGQSLPASTEVMGFAQGMVDGLTAGMAIISGQIVGLSGASITSAIQAGAGYPSITSELAGFGSSFASYIMANGMVTPSPPALPSGSITGLNGAAYAAELQTAAGYPSISPELLGFATAVMDHISNNAVVTVGVIS